jgi:anti-anti-sigma factor
MDRIVALKVLSVSAMDSPNAVSRFHREVRAAARLSHPNIVTAHDASEHEGLHYLVMEYVDGRNLAEIVQEHGAIPVDTAINWALQVAKGLEYAHAKGMVHRDIKPANLLLNKEGTVKILDMGLALLSRSMETPEHESTDQLTSDGLILGTCYYIAPEQAEDAHAADHRSDIYSLGCTLYRLVTGELPYKGDSVLEVLLAHKRAPVPSLCEIRSDVPPQLDAVFQKMVAKRPEDRYQEATEVIADLQACHEPSRMKSDSPPHAASTDSQLRRFLERLPRDGVAGQESSEKTVELQAEQQTIGDHQSEVINWPTRQISGQQYRCPMCGAKLRAGMPILDAPCRGCGYGLWCCMRIVGNATVLDVLPDRVPTDVNRLANSLVGYGDTSRIIVNLSSVDKVDSSFLARILALNGQIQQHKGKLILCCLSPSVRDYLATTKLNTLLETAADEDAALVSL